MCDCGRVVVCDCGRVVVCDCGWLAVCDGRRQDYSAAADIEGAWATSGHPLTKLSEQEMIDCGAPCLDISVCHTASFSDRLRCSLPRHLSLSLTALILSHCLSLSLSLSYSHYHFALHLLL